MRFITRSCTSSLFLRRLSCRLSVFAIVIILYMVLVVSVVVVAASESMVRRMVQSYVVFMQTLLFKSDKFVFKSDILQKVKLF